MMTEKTEGSDSTVRDFVLRLSRMVLLSTSCMVVPGCGGGHDATVAGTVTLDGEPLATGTVTFHPVGEGAMVYGQIDSDGGYMLRTGAEVGLSPGDYRVTVVATKFMPPTPDELEPPPRLLTPTQYASVLTTDFQFTVTSGSNDIPLKLISSP